MYDIEYKYIVDQLILIMENNNVGSVYAIDNSAVDMMIIVQHCKYDYLMSFACVGCVYPIFGGRMDNEINTLCIAAHHRIR